MLKTFQERWKTSVWVWVPQRENREKQKRETGGLPHEGRAFDLLKKLYPSAWRKA